MKSKTTAAVLALFLGGWGAHKFYLGQGLMGLIYLLFFWTFIPAMVAFVEAILLLMMSETAFNLRYNTAFMGVIGGFHGQQAQSTQNTQAQNITINIPDAGGAGGSRPVTVSLADQISQLHNLRVTGALSDEEFESQKQLLLTQAR